MQLHEVSPNTGHTDNNNDPIQVLQDVEEEVIIDNLTMLGHNKVSKPAVIFEKFKALSLWPKQEHHSEMRACHKRQKMAVTKHRQWCT